MAVDAPLTVEQASVRAAPPARPGRRGLTLLGVVPFFAFAVLFLLFPVGFLVVGSFQDSVTQAPTLQNYVDLSEPNIVLAYTSSIEISLVTAVAGGIFGFLLAYAVILGGLPRFLRSLLMTFSGVASNFAGVPLALAFTFTLGLQGLVTKLILTGLGIDLYSKAVGFSIYTKLGLELTYLYFQFPLMVLIVAPAIDGLKREWREASENLGGSSRQYWQHIALPILMPTLLGTVILLFGNSFGAQATAYQLTAGLVPLVTNLITAQISGDVFHNVNLGYALAMGMVVIMGISITGYSLLQRRSERWLR
jgi:putative spermidine/putrescine transport system permease protein